MNFFSVGWFLGGIVCLIALLFFGGEANSAKEIFAVLFATIVCFYCAYKSSR